MPRCGRWAHGCTQSSLSCCILRGSEGFHASYNPGKSGRAYLWAQVGNIRNGVKNLRPRSCWLCYFLHVIPTFILFSSGRKTDQTFVLTAGAGPFASTAKRACRRPISPSGRSPVPAARGSRSRAGKYRSGGKLQTSLFSLGFSLSARRARPRPARSSWGHCGARHHRAFSCDVAHIPAQPSYDQTRP